MNGASVQTSLLLVAYAAGAATSLAVALLIGGRVFTAMKRSLGAGEWIRRGLGVAVLAGVVAIALGLDTGFLSRISVAGTTVFEQGLLDAFRKDDKPNGPAMAAKSGSGATDELLVEGDLPPLTGVVEWLNSPPLTPEALRGKVVLIDFWTYSCINCLRAIPYVKAWAQKYKDQGLVVIGVHSPEFAFEKSVDNVRRAVRDLKIDYPVAVDSNFVIWRRFDNQYWPAHYFIDAAGHIRHHHFGEGEYAESERVIQQLLAEAGSSGVANDVVKIEAAGAEAAADAKNVRSSETYVGYERAEHFASSGGAVHDAAHAYSLPPSLGLNEWGLDGSWTVENERAVLDRRAAALPIAFTRATCTWCLARERTANPFASASCSTASRPAPTTAPMSTSKAKASSRSSGSINSCASTATSRTGPSRSSSSIRTPRLLPLRSAEAAPSSGANGGNR